MTTSVCWLTARARTCYVSMLIKLLLIGSYFYYPFFVYSALQSVEKLIREAIGKDHVMEFDQSAPSQFSSEAHPMTWQERGASIHLNSKAYRPDFLRERIRSQPLRKRACDNCRTTILMDKAVRCMSFDCKTHLCSACDTEIHLKQVFHSRELVTPQSSIALLPTEFFNLYWEKTYRGNSNYAILNSAS